MVIGTPENQDVGPYRPTTAIRQGDSNVPSILAVVALASTSQSIYRSTPRPLPRKSPTFNKLMQAN